MNTCHKLTLCALTALSLFYGALQGAVLAQSEAKRVPVLVELFTSEGCSSCPSADRLLSKLWREQPVEGACIVPLSEHVDYWNYLGWRDPYSQPSFTARQTDYQRFLRSNSNYTPQMVVNGSVGFVGSSQSQALEAIKQAAKMPRAELVTANYRSAGGELSFDLRILAIPPDRLGHTSLLTLATADDTVVSQITSGENAGAVLKHNYVLRHLETIKKIAPSAAEMGAIKCVAWIQGGAKVPGQHFILFLQDEQSRAVWGVVPLVTDGMSQ